MKVAIDASNIRAGGGVTHLVECLGALEPEEFGIKTVVVYCGAELVSRLPQRVWLTTKTPSAFRRGALVRFLWRHTALTDCLVHDADILLVPGGSYVGDFRPFVAMAQNLLPFDQVEQRREGMTLKRLRLWLLERVQGATFRRANGVIYMTAISRDQIERRLGFFPKQGRVVHHGTSSQFRRHVDLRAELLCFGEHRMMRLLYVSILEPYKHQRMVISAVAEARRQGLSVTLDLVGPAAAGEAQAIERLIKEEQLADYVRYHGPIAYDRLLEKYKNADAFLFASSCETFGIILLEAMAAGLPLLCSNRSALPEVAGDAALYFDPLDPESLVRAVRTIYGDYKLRRSLALQGVTRANDFSWVKCSRRTFGFLRDVHEAWKKKQKD